MIYIIKNHQFTLLYYFKYKFCLKKAKKKSSGGQSPKDGMSCFH